MKEFLNKRNIINLLLLGIMVLAIPLTVKLARQQQILFSRAAEAQIIFLTKDQNGTPTPDGQSCVTNRNIGGSNKLVTLCPNVKIRFIAPTGTDIRFQQAQSRTSLLQQGLVSTVYAGHLGYEANFCEGNSIVHEYPDRTHEVQLDCANDKVCKDLPNNDAGCVDPCTPDGSCSAATPACGETTTGKDNCSNPCTKTGDACPSGSNPGDSCDGYYQPDENGTTRYCHPGKILDNRSCGYNGDDKNTQCDIVSCPSPQVLVGNECKGTGLIPDTGGQCPDWQFKDTETTVCGQTVEGGVDKQVCNYETDTCTGTTRAKAGSCQTVAGACGAPVDDPGRIRNCYKCTQGKFEQQASCPANPIRPLGECSNSITEGTICYLYPNSPAAPTACGSATRASCNSGSDNEKNGTITATQARCVINKRKEANKDILPVYRESGWCAEEANYRAIVNNWWTINSQEEKNEMSQSCGIGGAGGQKCFVCRGNLWKHPGDNANADCTDAANSCTTTGTGTCKGPVNTLNTACGGGAAGKCFVCGNDGKYRYAGTDGSLTNCPTATCNPANANTCRSDQDLRTKPCNTAAPVITKYRFAENPSELASAPVNDYRQQGGEYVSFAFANTTLEEKFIWYQFGDGAGNWTEQKNEKILFVGPDPKIRGASCNLDIADGSLKFVATGDNFGARDLTNSHLAADNSNLEIREWANQKVVARMVNPPDTTTGKTYAVALTRSDGIRDTATCSVNTTQISFGAKLFCRAPSNFDQDNVKLTIVQNALDVGTTGASGGSFKAGGKARETVTISKEGVISNLKTKLEEGIEYIVCVKAPKSLRLCTKPFSAVAGNNIIIHKFELPVGDVNDDDAINSGDASICKAEWDPARAGRAKVCEFNRDNVTNSFEWSCLLHDFNAPNQPEPI